MVTEVRGDHESEWAAMTKVAQLRAVTTPEMVRSRSSRRTPAVGDTQG